MTLMSNKVKVKIRSQVVVLVPSSPLNDPRLGKSHDLKVRSNLDLKLRISPDLKLGINPDRKPKKNPDLKPAQAKYLLADHKLKAWISVDT